MRTSHQMITTTIQLYFTRVIWKRKEVLGITGSKYKSCRCLQVDEEIHWMMETYLEKIKPNADQAWITDELHKNKGQHQYLYALMDDESRFWIA